MKLIWIWLILISTHVPAQTTFVDGSFVNGAGTGRDGIHTLYSSFGPTQMLEADRDADGFVVTDDCDDSDPTIFPGAPELCDNKDNNCDGIADEGCAPVMVVSLNGTDIPNYYPSHYNVDFSNVDAGNIFSLPFQISNSGTATLTIISSGLSGIDADQFETDFPEQQTVEVEPGTTYGFTISFAPSGEGLRTALVSFSTNAADNPYEFTLSGIGKIVPLPSKPPSEVQAEMKKKAAKIQFVKGDGMKRTVLMKEIAVVAESKLSNDADKISPTEEAETSIEIFNALPTEELAGELNETLTIPVIEDNVKLIANADFTMAMEYKGYKVVYIGDGTEVEVVSLKAAQKYIALVYEFNELDDLSRYLYPPAQMEFATLPGVDSPTTQSTDMVVTPTSTTSLQVSLSPGDGQSRLAVMRKDSHPSFVPIEDVFYSSYQGVAIDETIVYSGSGSSFEVADLTPNTSYFISIFEYNSEGEYVSYLTSKFVTGTGTTFDVPSATLSGDASICAEDQSMLTIVLTGQGPWTGIYSANGISNSFTAGEDGQTNFLYSFSVTPTESTNYLLTAISDKYSDGVVNGSASIVVNAEPKITSLHVSLDPQAIGTPFNLSGTFDDGNPSDMSVDWGDGSVKSILFDGSDFSDSHAYNASGVYSVSVRLTDVCGSEAIALHQYVVIYDPSTGFVTGGGWFNSPAGAYAFDPLAVGKASFGFVSRYKKGTTVPDGNTDFQFETADLKFKSTGNEWLVIAGSKAMYKGVGELNGDPGFGFLISAIDGAKKSSISPDKFRIKIWDESMNVVYDNQLGYADDAAAITILGGGSIVIHEGKSEGTAAAATQTQKLRTNEFPTVAYPNPFTETITVEFSASGPHPVSMQVIDMAGKSIYDREHAVAADGRYILNIAQSGDGLFILKISQGQNSTYLKLVRR